MRLYYFLLLNKYSIKSLFFKYYDYFYILWIFILLLLDADFYLMIFLCNFVKIVQTCFYHCGWCLGAVNRGHRTHHRSRLSRYACAIRRIVRRARGYIKAATCWATRILPIRFRREYILLEDEKGNEHPTGDHDGIFRIVRLQVTTPAQFVTRVIDVGFLSPIRLADQTKLTN